MKRTIIAAMSIALALAAIPVCGATQVEWAKGKGIEKWNVGGHQCRTSLESGGLVVVCNGADGHLYSPAVDLKASALHELVIRARGDRAGFGEVFWAAPKDSMNQKKSVSFEWLADGKWHEYRIRPFWQGEKRIAKFRIDFPSSAADGGKFEISRIAVEGVACEKTIPTSKYTGVAFSCTGEACDGLGVFEWAASNSRGLQKREFRLPVDGRSHRLYLDLNGNGNWSGDLEYFKFRKLDGSPLAVKYVWVEDVPDFPVDLVLMSARASDAFNRVGQRTPVTIQLGNLGTIDARNVRIEFKSSPGMRVVNAAELAAVAIDAGDTTSVEAQLEFERAGEYTLPFTIVAAGAVASLAGEVKVKVSPSLGLPAAAYVPQPKPAETDYDIGALYFPGWARVEAWQRVWKTCPERKPVLGWYDEANPEVVDWQIKWLDENGIRTLYVDWYWCRGSQGLYHWVKAFYKAKYRGLIKWAMMWANHNAAGSHSVEDQRAVTKFWIENYFNTPEYLTIDGKPVVWIWAPSNMQRDVPEGGCRRLLDISREMAVAAGYKGIHFVAMKWPESEYKPSVIQMYKDFGFDMTGIYHFMSHGGRSDTSRRFSYKLVADANPENWWGQYKSGILPFIPNLSTGWDDRPWNDHCEIYGKNAADFRRICVAAKDFADKTGVKRLCLAPLNEWGEGSYAEPNAEHGFGFYEAVRDVFCKRPAGGWPLNYGPKDVRLGPYDLPPPAKPLRVTSWDLRNGENNGWSTMMGIDKDRATGEGTLYRTTTADPAFKVSFKPVDAKRFKEVVVRMRTRNAKGAIQLFWGHSPYDMREASSIALPLGADGEWKDYVFPVGTKGGWRGRVGALRVDPCNTPFSEIEIASVRLVNADVR